MTDYLKRIDEFFVDFSEALFEERPLFPDFTGKVARKVGVVRGIEEALGGVGVQVTDSVGRRRFGGHSMRVSGSRFWAAQGLEVFKIQIFARWGSAVVLRYVADAPIANLTGELASGSKAPVIGSVDRSVVSLLDAHIRCATEQFEILKAEIARLDSAIKPSFLQNTVTKTHHRVLTGSMGIPTSLWRTHCGWPYAAARYVLLPDPPPCGARLCDTCFRKATTGEPSCDSPSDSGSSD